MKSTIDNRLKTLEADKLSKRKPGIVPIDAFYMGGCLYEDMPRMNIPKRLMDTSKRRGLAEYYEEKAGVDAFLQGNIPQDVLAIRDPRDRCAKINAIIALVENENN